MNRASRTLQETVMSKLSRSVVWLSVASVMATATAFPQAPQSPLYDPTQFPSVTGRVQQFTLTPRGEIDGVVLVDGTEVQTPPPLSTSMAYTLKPGDTVTVHGLRAAGIPLIRAFAIVDQSSGKTLLADETAPGPGKGRRPAGPNPPSGDGLAEAQGLVRMSLHGARGEINGVLLKDGTVVRFAPETAVDFASVLQPGKAVFFQGEEVSSSIGRVLEARRIGPSREQMSTITAPPPAPRPGPPPPPTEGPQ
jgi:hypothetical protein